MEIQTFLSDFKAERGGECSHTCIPYGRYFIPEHRYSTFLKLYAKSCFLGTAPCMMEFRTSPFTILSFDVDFDPHVEILDQEQLRKCHRLVLDCFEDAYSTQGIKSIWASAKDLDNLYSGLHCYFQNLYVSSQDLHTIGKVLNHTFQQHGMFSLDMEVFGEKKSMRMLFCQKIKVEDGEPRSLGRKYVPNFVFEDDGVDDAMIYEDESQLDHLSMLEKCSLRVYKRGVKCQEILPSLLRIPKIRKTTGNCMTMLPGQKVYFDILKAVYKKEYVIYNVGKTDQNTVFVATLEKECEICQETHKSNHIYFVVQKKYVPDVSSVSKEKVILVIYQKCPRDRKKKGNEFLVPEEFKFDVMLDMTNVLM